MNQKIILSFVCALFLCLMSSSVYAQSSSQKDMKSKPALNQQASNNKVTIQFSSNVKAEVYHGSKLLGVTPFSIERKKGAPMDLIFRANGYVTVSTRAYPQFNDRVSVEMTAIGKENTLFGYKKRIEGVDEKELESMD